MRVQSAGMLETMTDQEIFDRVRKVTVAQLGVKEEEVVPNASFQEDLGADSLGVVELVMSFEEAFGVEIPDDDVNSLQTVQEAVDYLKAKQSK